MSLTTIPPDYVKPRPGLHLGIHGSYPQAARLASEAGHRSGSHEWWTHIRAIRAYWIESGQLTNEGPS